jgi:hypothetical protein
MSEAGWIRTDRLIELDLQRGFAVLRVIGRGLIPVDIVPQGRGTRRGNRRRQSGFAEVAQDPQHRIHQTRVMMAEIPQPFRQRQHPLPHRHLGKDVIR